MRLLLKVTHIHNSPGMSQDEIDLSRTLSLTCNFVFIAEMFWKVATYSWKKYIKSRWNQLDFFLVVISVIPTTLYCRALSPLASTWARICFECACVMSCAAPLLSLTRSRLGPIRSST